jgi:transcriptional regulator with XRE-family HTH domain
MLAGNIAAARARRRLGQADLAERMRALGYKWLRQTAGDVETGRRQLRAGELYGIAMALEIPVTTLVIPWADEGPNPEVMLPSGLVLTFSAQFKVGNIPRFPLMWEGNTPTFENTDKVHEHAALTGYGDA